MTLGALFSLLALIGSHFGPRLSCKQRLPQLALIEMAAVLHQEDADLDVLNHPLLNIVYYCGCELVPSALVLYILRKLPPKRTMGYQQIPAS